MRDVASNDFFWPHMNRQIQIKPKKCKERNKSGKNWNPSLISTDILSLEPSMKRKQEMQLDF